MAARPRKEDARRLRRVQLWTEEEWRKVEQAAGDWGVTESALIRGIVLDVLTLPERIRTQSGEAER